MKQVPPRGPTDIRRHGTKFGNLKFVNPCCRGSYMYEGWNFNFGNTPLDWIQELLE